MAQTTKSELIKSFYKLLTIKPFEKITVKDIVEDCGVNRKTFYYYFADIYDLVEYVFRLEIDKFRKEIPQNASFEDRVIGIFEFVEKNKKAAMHLYNSSDGKELEKYIDNVMVELLSKRIKKFALSEGINEEDSAMICATMVFIFMGMFELWVKNGMQPDYREQINRILKMLDGTVDLMIKNLKKDT